MESKWMRGDRRKIKEILFQQGRSTAWLAREMGVERTHFEHILAGDRRVKDPLFWERIAVFLGVSVTAIRADAERVA